jgi:peptidoglycan/xylan/chitin deacetylase (PgdA/CDA1 family)
MIRRLEGGAFAAALREPGNAQRQLSWIQLDFDRAVLPTALFGVLALSVACAPDDTARTRVTPKSTTAASPVSAASTRSSAAAQTYRLHLRTEDDLKSGEADITITEKEDHSFQIQEQRPGDSRRGVVEQGVWQQAGETVAVEFKDVNGRRLSVTEGLKIEMKDGFPVVTAYSGKTLYRIRAAAFDLGTGDRHPLVRELHRRLARIPYLNFDDPGSDSFSEETRKAVVAFQEAEGLYPDGEVDVETWLLLSHPPPPLPTETPLPQPKSAEGVGKIIPAASRRELPQRTTDGRPIVYFTFDDGPAVPYSQQILDLLARYDAQGTFFVVGKQMLRYPRLTRAEAVAGHFIGNHSTHHKNLSRLNADQFLAEVGTTRKLILETAGNELSLDKDVHYLRPPYGALSSNTLRYAAQHGYTIVLWDIDPMDWRRPPAEVMAQDILRSAFPGAVVLLHDGGGDRSQSVTALGIVLRELTSKGYAFRSIAAAQPTAGRFH